MAQAKEHFNAMPKDQLVKEIRSIGIAGNRLNTRIQIAALNACHYSIAESYIQYGQNLLAALNSTQRKRSLIAFLEKHGNFKFNKDLKDFEFAKQDQLTVDYVDTIEDRWFDMKPPAPVKLVTKPVNVEDDFTKWLEREEKKVAESPNVKHKEWLQAVAEFHAKWWAEQMESDEHDEEPVVNPNVSDALAGKPERRRTIRKAA